MKRAVIFALAGLAAGILCIPAAATPLILTLTSGSTTITIQDDSPQDLNTNEGIIAWTGTIGTWTSNVVGGFGYPSIGTLSWPQLDLVSANGSTAASTLTILLTQGGFTSPPPPGFLFAIGGTTQGTIDAYACAGVTLGDCEQVHLGPFSTAGQLMAFSGSTSFPFADPEQDYQLGLKVVITHSSGGYASSFDAALEPVPEPGTYALIGAGLLGLGLLRRRLR